MKLTNPWIGYTQRSYRPIKASLLDRLRVRVPEINDFNESNILVIVLTMFAGLVEQLHYYIDNWARESYLSTCQLFSSAVKLTRILDYRVKANMPAYVDLYFTYLDANGNPIITTEDGVVPVGTSVKTENGINFLTTENLIIPAGKSYGKINARQWTKIINQNLGVSNNQPNQQFDLPLDYANNTLEINIGFNTWTLQKTFARSKPNDQHYIVDVGPDGIPYVKFGNGIKGKIPDTGDVFINGSYYVTEGFIGNTISEQTITQIQDILVIPNPASSIRAVNILSPIGGYGIETIEDIRINAPLSIRTLDRAVTKQDYTDIALQADNIVKATGLSTCSNGITLYIAPRGGGIANQGLLDDTKQFIEGVKMWTTKLQVLAAGITPVYVELLVKAKFRADKIQCKIDCDNALDEAFSFENQDINGRVAFSDVVALIDNLDRVDTVEVIALTTLPYAFPLGVNTIPLDWVRRTLPGSVVKTKWRIVYTGIDLRIFKNGGFNSNQPINVTFTLDNILEIRVNDGMYSMGDYWEFTSYPYNKTIITDDNTIPIIIANQTTNITVN